MAPVRVAGRALAWKIHNGRCREPEGEEGLPDVSSARRWSLHRRPPSIPAGPSWRTSSPGLHALLQRHDRVAQLHYVHCLDGRYPRNHGIVRVGWPSPSCRVVCRVEGGAKLGQVDPLDRGKLTQQDLSPIHTSARGRFSGGCGSSSSTPNHGLLGAAPGELFDLSKRSRAWWGGRRRRLADRQYYPIGISLGV